jgi:hypothetical protein
VWTRNIFKDDAPRMDRRSSGTQSHPPRYPLSTASFSKVGAASC